MWCKLNAFLKLLLVAVSLIHLYTCCDAKVISLKITQNDNETCIPEIVTRIDGAYITASTNVSHGCKLTLVPIAQQADGFLIVVDQPFGSGEYLLVTNSLNQRSEVLNRENSYCLITNSLITVNYFHNSTVQLQSNFAVIVTQHVCHSGQGIWSTVCKLGTCRSLTEAPCKGAVISSELLCDGFNSCPLREDESSCIIRTISSLAFIGTLIILLLVIVCALIFGMYTRLARRNRQQTRMTTSYNASGGSSEQSGHNAGRNIPPSYGDVANRYSGMSTSNAFGHSDVVFMEDLPKYESVSMTAVHSDATIPTPAANEETVEAHTVVNRSEQSTGQVGISL